VKPSRLTQRSVQLGFVALVGIAWWIATAHGAINPLLLPPPAAVYREFLSLLRTGSFWPDLRITLYELAVAFSIAAVAGSATGYLVSRSRYAIRVFDPLFAGIFAIPAILLYPLYVLFFGLGPGSKIAMGASIAFFPVVLNTISGLSRVDRTYVTAARSMGASSAQMFWSVMMPAAFPIFLAGLRMGLILAFLSILGAETISSFSGLGHQIAGLAENMDTARMFAYIVFVLLIAFLLNFAVSFAEARGQSAGGTSTGSASANESGSPAGAKMKLPPVAARLGIVAAFLVAWEAGARLFGDPLFVSPPSRVLVALAQLAREKEVLSAVTLTCWELIAAFALSVAIGLIVGLIVGLNRFSRGSIYPIILLLYAVPLATVLPLFVIVFGIGAASKIAFGVSHGVFPIILAVAAGVQNIKPILLTSARSMGASRRQLLFSVVFPHMLPSLFTGMRLAMSAVLLGVLLAELYVSQSGVGYLTSTYTQSFQPQNLFALIAILAAIAVALNELCRSSETRLSRWHA
jgi:ABC-type nitrate/sulfonate/bicarbonate transport system permease component